eukprot:GHVN01052733.1.p1 GENE.GHVN01052733.1~~GHVN01052733.1.p1  ORF type:complete len:108 (+),score=18.11 GHVN01052733.1:43-366(+)
MGTTHSTHIMNATDETVVVSLTYPGAKTMLTERVTVPHNEDVTITTKYGQVTGTLMEVDYQDGHPPKDYYLPRGVKPNVSIDSNSALLITKEEGNYSMMKKEGCCKC